MLTTLTLPTLAELVARAIADTDFVGDISADPEDMAHVAANAADLAVEQWEEAHDYPVNITVPSDLIALVRTALIARAQRYLDLRAAETLDGMESGDLDDDGCPAPYARYRSL